MKNISIFLLVALLILPFSAAAQKTTVTRINHSKTYRTITKVKPQRKKKDVWYRGEVDLGCAIGGSIDDMSKTYSLTGPFIETVHGIHITDYVFIGVGIGIHYPIGYAEPFIPAFADFKIFYPINEKFAPFINGDIGYEIYNNGLYFGAGAGLKYKRWQFSAGVRSSSNIKSYDPSDSSGYRKKWGFTGYLKVGFTFGSYKKH